MCANPKSGALHPQPTVKFLIGQFPVDKRVSAWYIRGEKK